jgi:exodeoxyribonuclease VII large subunit
MKQRQQQLQDRLERIWQEKLRYWRQQQEHYLFQIETLNPKRTLERGYSLILEDSQAIRDPKDLSTAKRYTLAMAKGTARVSLDKIELSKDD